MKIFLQSSDQQSSKEARLKMGGWIDDYNPKGVLKYEPLPGDDPTIYKPGDHRFNSIVNIGTSLGGAIILLGYDDTVEDRENLWIQYAILVGILGQYRATICRYGNVKIASEMAGINNIDWEIKKDQKAQGQIIAWLKTLDELNKDELLKTSGYILSDEEVSLLALMHERKVPYGYTTYQMAEKHLIAKAISTATVNDLLDTVVEKGFVRREMINNIPTYFITGVGEKYIRDNPNTFRKRVSELGLIDKATGELGAKP
jgi:hypothetical protein